MNYVMRYGPYVIGIAPFWIFGLFLYVHFYVGVKSFSQEWIDAALMFPIQTWIVCIPAILIVRLIMHFQGY